MKDFFISYNKADRAWAEWIAWQLEQAGYSVVIQKWDFRPGSNFVLEMDKASQEAHRTIAILSPDYLDAHYTKAEWGAAFRRDPTGEQGILVPVRVQPCNLKGLLSSIVYTDLVGREQADAREVLLRGIRSGRAKPGMPPTFPGNSQQPPFPGTERPVIEVSSIAASNPDSKRNTLYPANQLASAFQPGRLTDFVIITALQEELEALLDKLPSPRRLPPIEEDVRVYYQVNLPITFSNGVTGTYQLVLLSLLGMGRVQAANATADAIRQWHPRYVLLVGIAGGIAEAGVSHGDVLISDQVVDYELQKLTAGGEQIRWEAYRADSRLLEATRHQGTGWLRLIRKRRPRQGTPKRLIGPIATGDKVVSVKDVLERYRSDWPKLIGIEMEAGGVASAAFQSARQPGFLMIRGVSDLADKAKDDSWRQYACHAAAAYALGLLQSGPIPPAKQEEIGDRHEKHADRGQTRENIQSNIRMNVVPFSPAIDSAPLSYFHVPAGTPYFVGRETELSELIHLLEDSENKRPKVCALIGMGGIGKTELAARYCHTRRDHYDFVWWFTAASRSVVVEQLVTLASSVGIPSEGVDAEVIVAQMRNWLETTAATWLIVFDNADDPASLTGLIPTHGRGRVLITSRYTDWADYGVRSSRLRVLPVDAATQFLEARSGRVGDPDATMLAGELQGLALALKQAAAFVSRAGWSFGRYLTMLHERSRDVLRLDVTRPSSLTGVEQTVYTVWQSSVDRAISDAPYARDVLRVLSVLSAERIPRSIFSHVVQDIAGGDPLEIEKALASLAGYSLIELTEDHISLHRLIQTVEIAHMEVNSPMALFTTVRNAATLLNHAFPADSDDSEQWPVAASLLPHAINLSDMAADRQIFCEELAYLECHAASYLNARGARTDAKLLFERAERRALDSDNLIPLRALIHTSLARVERNLGDVDAAEHHATLAVNLVSDSATGPEISVAAHNILGRVLMDRKLLPAAEAEFRAALDVVSSTPLAPTRHAVVTLNHLGRVLLGLGAPEEAESLFLRALSLDKAIHANPHADTGWSLDNLAMARFALGQINQAEDLLRQALSIEASVHGPDHPRSAWSGRNLATVLIAQQRYEEAHTLLERSLGILDSATPNNRGEMLATLTLLKQTALELGNHRSADEINERLERLVNQ